MTTVNPERMANEAMIPISGAAMSSILSVNPTLSSVSAPTLTPSVGTAWTVG